MVYNNVVKPTSLFDIFEHINTLLIGGVIQIDPRTVKKYYNGYER